MWTTDAQVTAGMAPVRQLQRPRTARRAPPKPKTHQIDAFEDDGSPRDGRNKGGKKSDGLIIIDDENERSNKTSLDESMEDVEDLAGFGFNKHEDDEMMEERLARANEDEMGGDLDKHGMHIYHLLLPPLFLLCLKGKLVRDIIDSQVKTEGIKLDTKLGGHGKDSKSHVRVN